MIILSIRPCRTSRVLLHAVKSYDMGPSRFTCHPRGRCAADFYRPWPGLNTQPLSPVASTLTTTPQRRHKWVTEGINAQVSVAKVLQEFIQLLFNGIMTTVCCVIVHSEIRGFVVGNLKAGLLNPW
jgi:hypothetical protein